MGKQSWPKTMLWCFVSPIFPHKKLYVLTGNIIHRAVKEENLIKKFWTWHERQSSVHLYVLRNKSWRKKARSRILEDFMWCAWLPWWRKRAQSIATPELNEFLSTGWEGENEGGVVPERGDVDLGPEPWTAVIYSKLKGSQSQTDVWLYLAWPEAVTPCLQAGDVYVLVIAREVYTDLAADGTICVYGRH